MIASWSYYFSYGGSKGDETGKEHVDSLSGFGNIIVYQLSDGFTGFYFIIMLHNLHTHLHMHYIYFQCSKHYTHFKLKINYAITSLYTYRNV